jgi:hypothetical protein
MSAIKVYTVTIRNVGITTNYQYQDCPISSKTCNFPIQGTNTYIHKNL